MVRKKRGEKGDRIGEKRYGEEIVREELSRS